MKHCPNCTHENEENLEICWNCNYSFSTNKTLGFNGVSNDKSEKDIECLRCKVPILYAGNFKFHEGTRFGIFGDLFESFTNRESFDLYRCPNCGKIEFFSPLK